MVACLIVGTAQNIQKISVKIILMQLICGRKEKVFTDKMQAHVPFK